MVPVAAIARNTQCTATACYFICSTVNIAA
jgi:hypothetical protein